MAEKGFKIKITSDDTEIFVLNLLPEKIKEIWRWLFPTKKEKEKEP